ncbi:PRC-barrel domain-containing protein [Azospirillum rugosum]|uniref:PRC-barrel domain-containing protein n=1 Tax=Azospirillum rugosum TaxID=416170 RepID=A0ABS4SLB9_9PROT|nr:PRC-barrel domain-containing protein [Azospirillum rugosum]MBP2293353.1 hypothetical protein [Azospirillum rugosum]
MELFMRRPHDGTQAARNRPCTLLLLDGKQRMGTAMKSILSIATAALILGAAGSGLAQQSAAVPGAANEYREVNDDNVMVPGLNLTVGQLDDMNILGAGDTKFGEVEEVLMNSAGQPVALVVDLERSVGIGDKDVIVGLDQLRADGRNLITGLSSAQLGALPTWDD